MNPNITLSANRPGQSIIEFAIVLPILLFVIVMVMELMILFSTQMILSNAAWEGARAGATLSNPAIGDREIYGAVKKAVFGLDPNLLSIDIDPTQNEFPRNQPYPAPRGTKLEVIVSYPVQGLYLAGKVKLTGKAITTIEYQNP
jgi:hypothetical protein